jgi:alanyl-tRNA synthetase
MIEPEKNVERFYTAERIFRRGGNFLVKVFTKPEKVLSGMECMQLKDIYGIDPEDVYLMAKSHGFEIDYDEFGLLLDKDDKEKKHIRMCCA